LAEYILVLVSCPVKSARSIAKKLLAERLAACVNITTLESHYWWKGKIETSREKLLLIKTRSSLFPSLERMIKSVHPYEVPEIIALPIKFAHAPYLKWIHEETSRDRARLTHT
jgi:periplasmic divalent cation tolerance protein